MSILGKQNIILQICDHYTGDGLSIGVKNEEMCEFTEIAELHNCKTTLNFAHSFHFDTYEKLSAIFNVSILGKQNIILQICDQYTGDGLSIGVKN